MDYHPAIYLNLAVIVVGAGMLTALKLWSRQQNSRPASSTRTASYPVITASAEVNPGKVTRLSFAFPIERDKPSKIVPTILRDFCPSDSAKNEAKYSRASADATLGPASRASSKRPLTPSPSRAATPDIFLQASPLPSPTSLPNNDRASSEVRSFFEDSIRPVTRARYHVAKTPRLEEGEDVPHISNASRVTFESIESEDEVEPPAPTSSARKQEAVHWHRSVSPPVRSTPCNGEGAIRSYIRHYGKKGRAYWFESRSSTLLVEPPDLSKRPDLSLGDLYMHVTPKSNQLWLWTMQDDRRFWLPIQPGYERGDGRRLILTENKGQPSWVTERWCSKKLKNKVNSAAFLG